MAGLVVDQEGNRFSFDMNNVEQVKEKIGSLNIVLLQLDGEELNYVLKSFNNVPMNVKKSKNTWRKEMASFIFDNL